MQQDTSGHLLTRSGAPAKSQWTLSGDRIHLNHGSFGAVPALVQKAQAELKQQMEDNPVAWFADLPDLVEDARKEVAEQLGAAPAETVLVQNATAGLSTVYKSLNGGEVQGPIFVTDHGYGAVTMGAKRWAERLGVPLEVIRIPLAASPTQVLHLVEDALTETQGALIIDQITSPTALAFPVREICRMARRHGVLSIVDAAHAPGLIDNPVADLECDFWVGNLHKFACTPRGSAALVVKNDALRQRVFPLIDSWGTPLPYPERFKVQGTLDATALLAAPAAFRFIAQEFGWSAVRAHIEDMVTVGQKVTAEAFGSQTGQDHFPDVGCPAPGMRLVRLPDGLVSQHSEADALRHRLVRELAAEVGVTSFNGAGYLRLSAHAYTTRGDYEELVGAVVPRLLEWARS